MQQKVILTTGASSGIGRETALACARRGASTVLVARRLDRLEEVAREVEAAGGKALCIKADVSREEEVTRMVTEVMDRFGRIDVLINNAGIGLYARVEETTPEQFNKLWSVNFLGTLFCTQAVLPVFRRQNSGHIITVSSMTGRRGSAMKAAYAATKFAQVGFMESLRMELLGTPIHCTIVFPGSTNTEFYQKIENPGNREIRYYGPVQSATKIAEAIVRCIEKPRAEVITQRMGRLQLALQAISPAFVDWLVKTTVKRKQTV
jgi:short-subunit dehydrogenase